MTSRLSKIRASLPAISEKHKISLSFLCSFILLVLLFSHCGPNEDITSWDRTIGPATLAGIDIQKRTHSFSMLMFLWIPLVAFVFYIIYSKIFPQNTFQLPIKFSLLNPPVFLFVTYFSSLFSTLYLITPLPPLNFTIKSFTIHGTFFIGIFLIAFFLSKKTKNFKENLSPLFCDSSVIFPILLFITLSAYTSKYLIPFLSTKSDLYKGLVSSSFQDSSLLCIILALGSFILYNILNIFKNKSSDFLTQYICIFLCSSLSIYCITGINFNYATFITFAFSLIFIFYFTRNFSNIQFEWIKRISKGIVWVPAIITICLEITFILEEKGIIIPFPWGIIFFICCIFLFVQNKFPSCIYIGTLVSLCFTAFFKHTYQLIWDFKDYANLYEMGNKTVALETIFHGKLPFVDYFSAHAIYDIWTQILHAFISPSIIGILADPFGGLNELFALVILYFILRKFISPAAAILFIAFFPFNILGIKAYNICFIAVFMHFILHKNISTPKTFIFWFVIAVNAFFLYDDGVSLGIASIATTSLMFICNRDKIGFAKFIGIGSIVGIAIATIASILCIIRGIAPTERLAEWIHLTLKSSAIWATVSMGNFLSPSYIFAYFIAPAIASFALYYTSYKSIRYKNLSIIAGATIIFAIAELLFIPRGIIFHNLTENNGITGRLLNFFPWTISCFSLFLLEERNSLQPIKNWCWIFVFGASLYISGGFVTRYLPNANNQLTNASIKASSEFQNNNAIYNQESRVVYSKQTNVFIKNFKKSLDSILKPNETFLDFSNSTALYAMVGKQTPSYVAQTPGLLSTLFSQKKFIEQIKKESPPIAIIGNADFPYLREMTWEPHNIPHNIRYYAVAEYIYENYEPYKIFGDYAFWCQKKRCTNSLPYDYDANLKNAHHYSLGMLPYIWAHYDVFNAITNPEIIYSDANYVKKSAYLYLSITNEKKQNSLAQISLTDTKTNHSITFDFTTIPGKNQYLIRISADSYWYGYNLNKVQLKGQDISLHNFKFLEGD